MSQPGNGDSVALLNANDIRMPDKLAMRWQLELRRALAEGKRVLRE